MKEIICMTLFAFWQLIFWDTVWCFALGRMKVRLFNTVSLYTRWGIYAVTALVMAVYFAMAG